MFSVVAAAFVPLNFIAVRLAQQYVHPRVLTLAGGNLPGSMRLTFLIALGMAGFGAALVAGQRLGQTLRAWLAHGLLPATSRERR